MVVEIGFGKAMSSIRHLPNALSLARLFLVPAILWSTLSGQWTWAFWLFAAAGISDAVDGALARMLNARTLLGAWLDPLADKVLAVSVYLSLATQGILPLWLAVLVAIRDVAIVYYAVMDIVSGRLPRSPLLISKINTVAQILLASFVLARLGFGWGSVMLTEGFALVVAVTTVASGMAYLIAETEVKRQ